MSLHLVDIGLPIHALLAIARYVQPSVPPDSDSRLASWRKLLVSTPPSRGIVYMHRQSCFYMMWHLNVTNLSYQLIPSSSSSSSNHHDTLFAYLTRCPYLGLCCPAVVCVTSRLALLRPEMCAMSAMRSAPTCSPTRLEFTNPKVLR